MELPRQSLSEVGIDYSVLESKYSSKIGHAGVVKLKNLLDVSKSNISWSILRCIILNI